jgi:transposase-like protein
MSKRGPRFSEKEKLAILKEGEGNGVNAVCAQYGMSDQTWRYKAHGVRPRKHFSLKNKLKILEEGARNGIYRTCAANHISRPTYYNWRHKLGFTKLPRRGRLARFNEEEKLAILREGEKIGVKAVCAKYAISDQNWRRWRYKIKGIEPKKQFSIEKKREILEEGFQNGIERVCAAYRIHSKTYYSWKRKLGFTKSPPRQCRPRRFTKEQVLAMAREVEKTSTKAVCEKYGISHSHYSRLRYQVTGVRLKKSFSPEEKLRILEEGYQNGILRTCNAYGITMTSYYHWKSELRFDKSPQRSFSEEERLQIVNEAIRDGIIKAGDRHHLSEGTIRRWAKTLGVEIPRHTRYNIQEKHAIIKEALLNGVIATCRAYEIDRGTLRYWRRALGL